MGGDGGERFSWQFTSAPGTAFSLYPRANLNLRYKVCNTWTSGRCDTHTYYPNWSESYSGRRKTLAAIPIRKYNDSQGERLAGRHSLPKGSSKTRFQFKLALIHKEKT